MVDYPTQILKVTKDHSTLYVRIPRDYVKLNDIKKSTLMVCKFGPKGELILSKFEDGS